jgi:lipopolysaccharide export system protein LptA
MNIKHLALLVACCGLSFAALADTPPAKPGGLSKESKDPISIEADSLEIFDKEHRAIYTGNVIIKQGDTTLKAQKMVIFYDQPEGAATPAANGTPDGDTTVRRVEADGNVVILDKDQIATGDHGVYESATDIMTLTGNVALSKGQNVTKGQKLVYNLGTGVANVDAGTAGRVTSTFVPSDKSKSGAPAPVPPTKTTK